MGLPASRARFVADRRVVHWPGLDASWMVVSADGALASSVMPMPFSERSWPRSMVSVPSHALGHHSVPASPSIAFDAGSPVCDESALAWPDSAQLMPRADCGGHPSRLLAAFWRAARPAAATAAPVVTVAPRARGALLPPKAGPMWWPGNGDGPAVPPPSPATAA